MRFPVVLWNAGFGRQATTLAGGPCALPGVSLPERTHITPGATVPVHGPPHCRVEPQNASSMGIPRTATAGAAFAQPANFTRSRDDNGYSLRIVQDDGVLTRKCHPFRRSSPVARRRIPQSA
jgi:hypothetical protein